MNEKLYNRCVDFVKNSEVTHIATWELQQKFLIYFDEIYEIIKRMETDGLVRWNKYTRRAMILKKEGEQYYG
jgi:hypothetical protein